VDWRRASRQGSRKSTLLNRSKRKRHTGAAAHLVLKFRKEELGAALQEGEMERELPKSRQYCPRPPSEGVRGGWGGWKELLVGSCCRKTLSDAVLTQKIEDHSRRGIREKWGWGKKILKITSA